MPTSVTTATNPGDYDVSSQRVGGGLKVSPAGTAVSLVLKSCYERLDGTGNAFQGTAERYLTAPCDGSRDTYGSWWPAPGASSTWPAIRPQYITQGHM